MTTLMGDDSDEGNNVLPGEDLTRVLFGSC